MRLTPKRMYVLRSLHSLETRRKNGNGSFDRGITAADVQRRTNDVGYFDAAGGRPWTVSANSVQTYLDDLRTLGLVDRSTGFAGSWFVTEEGRKAIEAEDRIDRSAAE